MTAVQESQYWRHISFVRFVEKCRDESCEANVSLGVVSSCLVLVDPRNLATLQGNRIIHPWPSKL